MSKKIAVILSGCGVYDGAEIHESVILCCAWTSAALRFSALPRTLRNTM